jgi:hypothetical protein
VADQGGLARAAEGDQGEDVGGGVVPGGVEAGELGFSAEEEGAGDGEAAEVEAGWGPAARAQKEGLGGPSPQQFADLQRQSGKNLLLIMIGPARKRPPARG